ncbi:hypothetical protein F383_06557 [Gossypium arboreum]|uniref:Uncharacterized protein n=1 Tax=Gossypium arboreum TaxID=29729 RepID=A0A0B0PL85_GOSAR|nr:hypothetical protein F383_06557 [Gossypium arboreum]
MAVASNRVKAC